MRSPGDIMIIFLIIASFMLLVGYGIDSINTNYNAQINDSRFNIVKSQVSGDYKNVSGDLSSAVQSESGQLNSISSESNIIVKGFNAILGIGRVVVAVFNNIEYFFTTIGLPEYFATLVIGVIITLFAIITYSWIRGNA